MYCGLLTDYESNPTKSLVYVLVTRIWLASPYKLVKRARNKRFDRSLGLFVKWPFLISAQMHVGHNNVMKRNVLINIHHR